MKVERFETSLIKANFDRLMRLLPFMVLVSSLMLFLSYYLKDLKEVKWANGFLLTYSLLSYLVAKLGWIDHEIKLKEIWQNALAFVILLWGTLILGYKTDSFISYFDFVIVFVVSGVVIQMKWQMWVVYDAIIVGILVFLMPFLELIEESVLLTMLSILFFLAMILYMNIIFYNQSYANYLAHSQLQEHQVALEKKVLEKTEALLNYEKIMMKEVALLLTTVLEYYDEYTRGHSESVALISEAFAKTLNLSLTAQKEIYWAGLIHDVGKIYIDKELLNKSEPLENDEFDLIKKHAMYGYEMTKNSEALKDIAKIIRHHHERYDGSGYPDGLRGESIPLPAQIIAIADAWDVMRSDRTYKNALSLEKARLELIKNSGTQFSPKLVAVFLDLEYAQN